MRRLLVLSFAICFVALLVIPAFSQTGGPDGVQVCHVVSSDQLANGIVQVMGMVETLPPGEDNLESHLNLGDVVLNRAEVAENGTCCAFSVMPNGRIVAGRVD